MFNAGSDKFNSIVSGYPWVAHVINCFIEFGDVDFPKGKIPTCDLKTYDKLCSRSCKTPETQAARAFRRFFHPENPREIKMADIKT